MGKIANYPHNNDMHTYVRGALFILIISLWQECLQLLFQAQPILKMEWTEFIKRIVYFAHAKGPTPKGWCGV